MRKGVSSKLLKQLTSLPPQPDFLTLFRIADSCKSYHPDFFRNCAKIATAHGFSSRSHVVHPQRFAQRFGRSNTLELAHSQALAASVILSNGGQDDDYFYDPYEYLYDFEDFWLEYTRALPEEHEDTPLITALVYRYIVHAWDKYSEQLGEDNAQLLEKSLLKDPAARTKG